MDLVPYVFFYGRCEEALAFYQSVLGGSYDIVRARDMPPEHRMHDRGARVMHAEFRSGGITFWCGDGRDDKPIDPDDAGNVSLCLRAADRLEVDRVFAALGDGGEVQMPLNDRFFPRGYFGVVTDRFGVEWFVSAP